jgi:hypothetical protein
MAAYSLLAHCDEPLFWNHNLFPQLCIILVTRRPLPLAKALSLTKTSSLITRLRSREKIMRRIFLALSLPAILFALVVPSQADTIRLKDGSVIHGQVLGFKDQQFTILVGGGARGRRSSITIFMEDVESIEFDAAPGSSTSVARNEDSGPPRALRPVSRPVRPSPTPT